MSYYCTFQIPRQFVATHVLIRIPSYPGARTKKHLLHGVVIKDSFIEDQPNIGDIGDN